MYIKAPLGFRAAGIRQIDTLPSPVHDTKIPDIYLPLRKRPCRTAPTPRYEVGESSTAGAARDMTFLRRTALTDGGGGQGNYHFGLGHGSAVRDRWLLAADRGTDSDFGLLKEGLSETETVQWKALKILKEPQDSDDVLSDTAGTC
ncbi:hypothetical protein Tco_1216901 [Tanacetum coccineum]